MALHLRLARLAATACLLFSLSACAGVLGTTEGERNREGGELEEEEINLAQYEDFDFAPYREEAPAAPEEEEALEHDVPAQLLSGRAAEGIERTVQGFRVQILSSKDRSDAEEAAAEAEQWWREQVEQEDTEVPGDLFASGGKEISLPVYTVYRQPFYRVRVGDFTARSEAERALEFLGQRYGDAFIARDEVRVTQ